MAFFKVKESTWNALYSNTKRTFINSYFFGRTQVYGVYASTFYKFTRHLLNAFYYTLSSSVKPIDIINFITLDSMKLKNTNEFLAQQRIIYLDLWKFKNSSLRCVNNTVIFKKIKSIEIKKISLKIRIIAWFPISN